MSHHRTTIALTLFGCFFASAFDASSVHAQHNPTLPKPTRQRELSLPFNGNNDLLLQYQMMQRLSDLAKQQSSQQESSQAVPPQADTPSEPPFDYGKLLENIDPEDLDAFRSQAEKFLEQQPGSSSDTGSIPPGLVDALRDKLGNDASDPRIADLLKRFNESGQLPRSQGGSDNDNRRQPWIPQLPSDTSRANPSSQDRQSQPSSPPPSNLRPSNPPPSRPQPRTSQQPDPSVLRGPTPRPPNSSLGNDSGSLNRRSPTAPGGTKAPDGTSAPDQANDPGLRQLRPQRPSTQPPGNWPPASRPPLDQQPSNRPPPSSPPNASSRQPTTQTPTPGNPERQNLSERRSSGGLPEQLKALIKEHQRRQQQDDTQGPPTGDRRGSPLADATRGSSTDSKGLPSVQDFLKEAQQDPSQLPSLGELLRRMPDAKDLPLSELSKLGRRDGDSSSLANNLKSRLPPEVLRDLDRNGFKKTLSDLVKKSESQANLEKALQSDAPEKTGLGSNLEKAFLSALDGVREDIFEKDSDKKSKASSSNRTTSGDKTAQSTTLTPNSQSNSLSPTNSLSTPSTSGRKSSSKTPSSSSGDKPKGGFLSDFSKFVNRLATGSNKQPAASSPASPVRPGNSSVSPDLSGASAAAASAWSSLSNLLLPIAALGILGIAAWWFMRKNRQAPNAELAGLPVAAIHTPDDIVQAFHALVRRGLPTKAEQWWNHRYTVDTLADQTPSGQRGAWQQLASLYEAARYAPTVESLAPEKIATAQQIIQKLASSASENR